MDSPINKIDELLSGKLDGVLSEAESIELAREMVKNPSLETRLDELAALRKSLMSGRSTKRLGPDFAGSITLATKKRAEDMGENAPNWLSAEKPAIKIEKTLVPAAESGNSHRFMLVGAFTLAAAVLIAFFASPKKQNPEFMGEALVMVPEKPTENPDSKESSKIAAQEPASPETGNSQAENSLAASDAKSVGSAISVESNTPATKNLTESIASLESPGSATSVEKDIKVDKDNALAASSLGKVDPKQPIKPTKLAPMLLVFDLHVESNAIENRVLERILEKHGIVYTDELVLDDEQLTKLQESQLIGPPSVEEKMGVLFVRSTALNLGLALEEIIVDAADFPAYGLDIATHDSARLLVQQLSEIQVVESTKGFAGRLSLASAPGNPSPFAASKSRAKPGANRARNLSGLLPAHQEMSNVLFLLRPAK